MQNRSDVKTGRKNSQLASVPLNRLRLLARNILFLRSLNKSIQKELGAATSEEYKEVSSSSSGSDIDSDGSEVDAKLELWSPLPPSALLPPTSLFVSGTGSDSDSDLDSMLPVAPPSSPVSQSGIFGAQNRILIVPADSQQGQENNKDLLKVSLAVAS